MELPLPELDNDSLSWAAKDLEKRIRAQTPKDLRNTITVRPFRKGDRTGLDIGYDDEAEQFVQVAIEYPAGGQRHEDAVPHMRTL